MSDRHEPGTLIGIVRNPQLGTSRTGARLSFREFGEESKVEQEVESKKNLRRNTTEKQRQSETHSERGSTSGTGPPGQKSRPTGGGQGDEFNRVIAMLESIRRGVEPLVKTEIAGVPKEVDSEVRDSWPHVEKSFKT